MLVTFHMYYLPVSAGFYSKLDQAWRYFTLKKTLELYSLFVVHWQVKKNFAAAKIIHHDQEDTKLQTLNLPVQ
jgi:hypothetical protein